MRITKVYKIRGCIVVRRGRETHNVKTTFSP